MDKREREQKNYAQGMWALHRDKRNSLVESLTPLQHEAISNLCADRHYMHVNGEKDIWSEDSESSNTYCLVGGMMADSKIEKNDILIQEYLKKIDEEHGTSYSPSGLSRRLMD